VVVVVVMMRWLTDGPSICHRCTTRVDAARLSLSLSPTRGRDPRARMDSYARARISARWGVGLWKLLWEVLWNVLCGGVVYLCACAELRGPLW